MLRIVFYGRCIGFVSFFHSYAITCPIKVLPVARLSLRWADSLFEAICARRKLGVGQS